MKNIIWVMTLVSIGMAPTGCQATTRSNLLGMPSTPTNQATEMPVPTVQSQPTDSDEELRDWLKGIPCKPPCWEGITPGRTTVSQTLSLLRQLPFVTDIENQEAPTGSRANQGEIYWDWKGSSEGGGVIGYRVSSTVCRVRASYPYSLLTLQEVLDAYGAPSHVRAWARPSSDTRYTVYGLDIVYIPQGFALVWDGSNVRKPYLGPDWRNFVFDFFEPTLEGYTMAHGNPNVTEDLVPWRGMLSFDDYCVGSRCK